MKFNADFFLGMAMCVLSITAMGAFVVGMGGLVMMFMGNPNGAAMAQHGFFIAVRQLIVLGICLYVAVETQPTNEGDFG